MSSHMTGSLAELNLSTELCHFSITLIDSIRAVLLFTFIPILDLILVPFLRYTTINPSILKRLSIGATLAVLSVSILFLLEAIGSYSATAASDAMCMFNADEQPPSELGVDVYWLLLPIITTTVGEIFINIPGIPHNIIQCHILWEI